MRHMAITYKSQCIGMFVVVATVKCRNEWMNESCMLVSDGLRINNRDSDHEANSGRDGPSEENMKKDLHKTERIYIYTKNKYDLYSKNDIDKARSIK